MPDAQMRHGYGSVSVFVCVYVCVCVHGLIRILHTMPIWVHCALCTMYSVCNTILILIFAVIYVGHNGYAQCIISYKL